jgi:hypothetical protein
MKTTLALTLSLLLFTSVTQAQVCVYNQSYDQTEIGQNTSRVLHFTGYLVFDGAGNLAQIDVNARSKSFHVWHYSNFTILYLQASSIKQHMVISVPIGEIGGFFARGTPRLQDVGAGSINVPKAMTYSGTGTMYSDPDGFLMQFKGAATLNKTKTNNANYYGYDLDTTVDSLRQGLFAKGYMEI